MSIDTQVVRDDERHRYESRTSDGELAGFAEYRKPAEDVVEFTHTVVRDEFEGQGIGSDLARAALDQARADGLGVIASCEFIAGWIDKHPDYADLLVRG